MILLGFCGRLLASDPPDQITVSRPEGEGNPEDWAFLDNGRIRLGVKKTSGAAIGWLSLSGSTRNLLNHYDHGRLVQQSYYGDADGSRWDRKPWRWNPVQGGDWRGHPSQVLEFRADAASLHARVRPRHWASGEELSDVVMEERIALEGRRAHVRFKMAYTGSRAHGRAHQEIPAFFAEPDLSTLVLYDGRQPWTNGPLNRSTPGWPNEGRKITEHWAAYVDEHDFGVGAYVPVAEGLTCYRYQGGRSSCSYFAPLITMAIKPGTVFEYDLYLTVGKTQEIRDEFREVAKHAVTDPVKK